MPENPFLSVHVLLCGYEVFIEKWRDLSYHRHWTTIQRILK